MPFDVPVQVSFPEGDEADRRPKEAVLRINQNDFVLWFPFKVKGVEAWRNMKFRPFRGPRILTWAIGPFIAPFSVFISKRDITWIQGDGEIPILRLTPTAPPEFWVEINFRANKDTEAVVQTLSGLWKRSAKIGGEKKPFYLFAQNWLPFSGAFFSILFVAGIVAKGCGSNFFTSSILSLVGFVGFGLSVAAMVIVANRNDKKDPRPNCDRWNEV